ncbi:hypothetical protein D1872_330920 [compost metagenome]
MMTDMVVMFQVLCLKSQPKLKLLVLMSLERCGLKVSGSVQPTIVIFLQGLTGP